jgi:hypothetical protein
MAATAEQKAKRKANREARAANQAKKNAGTGKSSRKVRTNAAGKKIVTRTTKGGTKVKKVLSKKGEDGKRTTLRKVATKTGAGGATRKTVTGANGGKTKTRTTASGASTKRRTDSKGKVKSITKTNKDGETKKFGKASARVSTANRIARGKGENAKKVQGLKSKRQAARKAGDMDKVKSLRKEARGVRKGMTAATKARRAAKKTEE